MINNQFESSCNEMEEFLHLPQIVQTAVRSNLADSSETVKSVVRARLDSIEAGICSFETDKRKQWGKLAALVGLACLVTLATFWFALLVWPSSPRVQFTDTYPLMTLALSLYGVGGIAVSVRYLYLSPQVGPESVTRQFRQGGSTVELQDLLAALVTEVRIESEAVIRRIANNQLDNGRSSAVLGISQSPRLVEVHTIDTFESDAARSCMAFIEAHDTSALGICGPRGVGKTTIMRYLCQPREGFLGVHVPAPVSYSASELVVLIHQSVGKAILTKHEVSVSPIRAVAGAVLNRAIAGLICLGAALILGVVDFSGVEPDLIISWTKVGLGALVFIGLTLIGSSAWALYHELVLQRRRVRSPLDLARAELHQLKWLTKRQNWFKNSLSMKPFTVEDQFIHEESERELSQPQRVDALKRFLTLYTTMTDTNVVIALDELDKIASPELAVEAVNGVKDLLHIDRVHFIVSVSEDALASFALRGVPVRDAFDSAFDLVVGVKRLTFDDSLQLVVRRVIGTPDRIVQLSHVLSGGLPRDLIRFLRACIDVRRTSEVDVSVSSVAKVVTRAQALVLLEGVTLQVSNEADHIAVCIYEVRRAVADCEDAILYRTLERAAVHICNSLPDSDVSNASVRAIGPVLGGLATAGIVFGADSEESISIEAQPFTDDMARYFADLGMSAAVSRTELNRIRREAGLPTLDFK
ncbi:hypothetical protein [Nocardia asteroides]|uniref:hypothetical protein n=1 Tax=Nocardia asteroides TaxID=1824 RepID=UPI001E5FF6F1|nr:hypothetical protein [Nocardia asteroides]UGT63992.1 hypothetical protein LTT61_12080 [Nocardia asteroides]